MLSQDLPYGDGNLLNVCVQNKTRPLLSICRRTLVCNRSRCYSIILDLAAPARPVALLLHAVTSDQFWPLIWFRVASDLFGRHLTVWSFLTLVILLHLASPSFVWPTLVSSSFSCDLFWSILAWSDPSWRRVASSAFVWLLVSRSPGFVWSLLAFSGFVWPLLAMSGLA